MARPKFDMAVLCRQGAAAFAPFQDWSGTPGRPNQRTRLNEVFTAMVRDWATSSTRRQRTANVSFSPVNRRVVGSRVLRVYACVSSSGVRRSTRALFEDIFRDWQCREDTGPSGVERQV